MGRRGRGQAAADDSGRTRCGFRRVVTVKLCKNSEVVSCSHSGRAVEQCPLSPRPATDVRPTGRPQGLTRPDHLTELQGDRMPEFMQETWFMALMALILVGLLGLYFGVLKKKGGD